MTAHTLTDEHWAERVRNFGATDPDTPPDPDGTVGERGAPTPVNNAPVDPPAGPVELDPVDLDLDGDGDDDLDGAPHRFDHRIAWGFGGLVTAAVVATLVAAGAFYSHDDGAPRSQDAEPRPVAVAPTTPAPPGPTAPPGPDRPLPYTADAQGSCAPGSTPAQTMSGTDPRNAFVCVRSGGDGQTLTLDLGRTYVITAIALTPGWVGLDASGVSQWSQHRVVTLVQYQFDDPDRTLITQDTRNVHGEAVQPVKHVLASKVRLLIRQTSRPPAEPRTTPAPAPGETGLLPDVFGDAAPTLALPIPAADPFPGTSPNGNDDPVDATFAIGGLKILGHEAV
ncbi:hypothetical protein [Mycolicibacterium arenosum]|uniref:F5/8 type C domain-containing protein n=1 Tax=Mycolicibacterium arenosum TaxID=2952157 RepID=A0ABT1MCE0_9MYCO|nr:hypothetical protein [Mycolicibacterium sp. CAU 1645]MCP9276838.1 hypothetical protein [Mycolicibacterium sp. CAU 1645]